MVTILIHYRPLLMCFPIQHQGRNQVPHLLTAATTHPNHIRSFCTALGKKNVRARVARHYDTMTLTPMRLRRHRFTSIEVDGASVTRHLAIT